jgi:colanic acid biosynthesis glycosyl transferase WcaI
MKFAILTQYFPPEIGAPQTRLSELAKHLVQCGHDVIVLTAMPNYPSGKIHAGYGGILRKESYCGAQVIRTFIYPAQSAHIVPRMLNYFSFMVSSSLGGSFMLDAPDFLMVESPPLFLGIAGLWLQWLKNSKLIFNVSDLWPDGVVELGVVKRGGIVTRIAYWLEKICYEGAWLITGQSKSIVENIRERFPGRPVLHLSNGVETASFGPGRRTESTRALLGNDGQFVAVYAGLHGHAQGLSQILESARVLASDARFRFVLIGEGPEKGRLQKMAHEMGLTNVRFLDPLPHSEIPGILAAADAILVPLVGQITGAVPSKIYEAMASGRPLVLIATGEAAEIVSEYNTGLTVAPNDIEGIVDALRELRDNAQLAKSFGENGRNVAVKHFDRKDILERFTKFLITYEKAEVPMCPVPLSPHGGQQLHRTVPSQLEGRGTVDGGVSELAGSAGVHRSLDCGVQPQPPASRGRKSHPA